MDFINREKDIKYLKDHFLSEPNSLLFVYGPKSSGKSTLLDKVVCELDKKKYAINFLDLRRVIIYNFQTFLDVFFQEDLTNKTKDIFSGITFNMGFFNVQLNEKKLLKKNAFRIMEKKLESAKKRGIQPIIIIDEIQLLKHIYINGERYLIDELFNLFIALTKVKHLAHIVLATSDSYFIEEIYNSSKLAKTSNFFLLDHFKDKEVEKWLLSENFNKKEIGTVKKYIGGCPWEIREIIKEKEKKVKDICLSFVQEEYGKILNIILPFTKDKKEIFFEVIKEIVENGSSNIVFIKKNKIVIELLKEMIANDFWFYEAKFGKITANSKSIYWAFKKLIKTFSVKKKLPRPEIG